MRALVLVVCMTCWSPLLLSQQAVWLTDKNCGREVLVVKVEGADFYASCVQSGVERLMQVAVTNTADPAVGPIREFSIGFCGTSVVSATAQRGWLVRIDGDHEHNVTWSLPDALIHELGIPSRARVGEFVVHLKPGWKRSSWVAVQWESSSVAQMTTHDC